MEHSWIRMNIEAILLSPSQNRAPCDQPCPSRDIYGVRAPGSFAEAAASLGRGYDSRGKMKWSQQTGTSKTGTRVLRLHLGAAKSLDRRSHRHGSGRGDRPGASSDDLAALLALPNTHARSLDGVLTAESAGVARGPRGQQTLRAVLRDLNLLDDLTQRGAITRSVLSADADLLRSLALHIDYAPIQGDKRKRNCRSSRFSQMQTISYHSEMSSWKSELNWNGRGVGHNSLPVFGV